MFQLCATLANCQDAEPWWTTIISSVRASAATTPSCGGTTAEGLEPVYYGPDVAAALDWGRRFASTREALKRLDPDAAAGAVERLREALAAHRTEDGIWFGSRAWIVIAGTGDDEGDHGWATALLTSRETGGAARKYSDAGPANAH